MFKSAWKEIPDPDRSEFEAKSVEQFREVGGFGKLWPIEAGVLALVTFLFAGQGLFGTPRNFWDIGVLPDLNYAELFMAPYMAYFLVRVMRARGQNYEYFLLPDRIVRTRHGRYEEVEKSRIRDLKHSWTWRSGNRMFLIVFKDQIWHGLTYPKVSSEAAVAAKRWFESG